MSCRECPSNRHRDLIFVCDDRMLPTANLNRTIIYYVLEVLDLRRGMDGFILTMVSILVNDCYDFTCCGCFYSSWSFQRDGRYLMVVCATDINLAIKISINESHIASWCSSISSPIDKWMQNRTVWFRCATSHMLDALPIGFSLFINFVTKICLILVRSNYVLIRRAHEIVDVSGVCVRKYLSLVVSFSVRCHNIGMSIWMAHCVIWLFGYCVIWLFGKLWCIFFKLAVIISG